MCSSYLLLPDPICLHRCEDICKVKSPRLPLEHLLLFSSNSRFHSVRRCLSSGHPIKAVCCESQFQTSLHTLFARLAFSCAFVPEPQKRDCTNRKLSHHLGNSLLLCASFCSAHCSCIPHTDPCSVEWFILACHVTINSIYIGCMGCRYIMHWHC